jgi:serine/threonine-protein kinase
MTRLSTPIRAAIVTLATAGLAFITGLILFDEVVMPRFTRGKGDVLVPDLSNLSRDQAETVLGHSGLRLSVVNERFDAAVPKGFVLSQDPEPGRPVKRGRRVSVAVSLGEEFANVPELFGESTRGANLLLQRAGLRPATLARVITSEVGPGLIVASDPPFGAVVARGSAVTLLLCVANEPEAYVMPDLLGRNAESAQRDLEALGFHVQTFGPGSNFARVEAQEPPPGARVVRGQVIRLTVAGRLIE